jgi:poly(hydroxyalkanoate) granule-associated protein
MTSASIDIARQLRRAVLGTFLKIEQESSMLFKSLVQEGEKFEAHTKSIVEDRIEIIRDGMGDTVENIKDKATDTWDGLEQLFEDRVARVLGRIGVPTQEEVQELTRRIEGITQNVQMLIHKS